jgi:tetratricopeptide (TPR) repeat protein
VSITARALVLLLCAGPAAAQPERGRETAAALKNESVRELLQEARARVGRDPAVALDLLRRARTLAPNSEEVLSALAQVSLTLRAPLPAIAVLEPLTRMCPTVAEYHYLFGVALMQAGDLQSAVSALQESQRLEPNRALTLLALGLALNSVKQYAEAAAHLRRSLEVAPANVEAIAALAEAQEGAGDPTEAEALARRALAQSSTHATANLVLGLVLMKQERYADARDALLTSVTADPNSSKAHYQLSLAYARLGDAVSSEKHLALYRLKLREMQERLEKVRSRQ